MRERLLERFRDRFRAMRWALGLGDDPRACEGLLSRHGEPHRHYHTAAHVDAVLRVFDSLREHARRAGEVECALLYHDAVYDPRASDNEARSAALARVDLGAAGAPPDVVERVARMIEATHGHHAPADADVDTALVLDCDLAVLGADEPTYDAYARAVRAEYAHVPDERYRAGRVAFLDGMLARPRLFATGAMVERAEARARANLARERARLAAGGG
jgi:predicted metal-dependent HD superfamily phosphohydrolase